MQPAGETTTAQPDALTRLRNRPRLHVAAAKAKPVQPAQNNPTNRRTLVSGLLPRRRPAPGSATEPSTEVTATEEGKVEEEPETSETTAAAASTTEVAAEAGGNSRLNSLVAGRRRPPLRRPGFPRPQPTSE